VLVLEVLCNLQLNVMHTYGSDMRQDMKELKMFKDLTVDNVIDKGRIEFLSRLFWQSLVPSVVRFVLHD
jgi:hypothetical protein